MLYVAATTQVVNSVHVVERQEEEHAHQVQCPHLLYKRGVDRHKNSLTSDAKLLYAILITKRKLRHYFHSHPVIVVTSFPPGKVIHKPKAIARIAKWALKLMRYEISYIP